MNYYKSADDFLFSDGTTYVEVDGDCTIRQITVGDKQFVASNINYPECGFVLPDQPVNYDDFEEEIPITKQEFDAAWSEHLARHQQQWEAVKANYPVGKQVVGAILVFYPQGTIVDLGLDALAVADYAQCRASAQPEWMYPKHQVRAIVAGYDEDNHWVTLSEPQVLAETVG